MKIDQIDSHLTEWKENLLRVYESKFFLPGEILFKEDGRFDGLLFIYSGKIKVYKKSNNGSEEVLRIAGVGDFIGYKKSTHNSRYRASAKAIEDTITVFIPRNEFLNILR